MCAWLWAMFVCLVCVLGCGLCLWAMFVCLVVGYVCGLGCGLCLNISSSAVQSGPCLLGMLGAWLLQCAARSLLLSMPKHHIERKNQPYGKPCAVLCIRVEMLF